MSTIGFIGYGPINKSIARFALDAGHTVLLSNSRGPETLTDAVAELGNHARAVTAEEAARTADIVSISVPLTIHEQLPPEWFTGKIIIDTMNYYPQREQHIPELDSKALTSSEMVQRHFADAFVVKALNNLDHYHLANGPRPKGDPLRWAVPIAGDDDAAKRVVAEFIDGIGFDPVDIGTLADSWRVQGGTPGYVLPYIGELPEGKSVDERREVFRTEHTAVVTPDDVRRLAAAADREHRPWAAIEDLPVEFTGRSE